MTLRTLQIKRKAELDYATPFNKQIHKAEHAVVEGMAYHLSFSNLVFFEDSPSLESWVEY